ncbi:phytoene desaturase family protein [Nocardia sienata]|uniref:phytoene desaturase family protein n=1 Tax=Nocardia sienata TaxID=248552 RepID=UPI0007A49A45|nr:FAD-dependent oxidoreductase [Nocardia sienata]
MNNTDGAYDALVIGAGVGGLCAASRLVHRGYRVLVVESLAQVGGRASTRDFDGFKINNGAIVVEAGGVTEETFLESGVELDLRFPAVPMLMRIGNRDIDLTGGRVNAAMAALAPRVMGLIKRIGGERRRKAKAAQSMAEWLGRFTTNETVHGVVGNLCASIFSVSADELPAGVFLTYFTRPNTLAAKVGFCPQGTIGVWRALADSIVARGGDVWLSASVTSLRIDDGVVTGAVIEKDGETVAVEARVVVSNIGPRGTMNLVGEENVSPNYRASVRRGDRPTSMISINFASEEDLVPAPGLLSFARTRRLCYVANFTATCPEMAPPGWNLYVGAATPRPSLGVFDETAEIELLRQDLREQVPGFDRARILSIEVNRGEWPTQRAVAGSDVPRTTPFPNLWNVGDGVKEYATGGTGACAETAKLAVEDIESRYPAEKRYRAAVSAE